MYEATPPGTLIVETPVCAACGATHALHVRTRNFTPHIVMLDCVACGAPLGEFRGDTITQWAVIDPFFRSATVVDISRAPRARGVVTNLRDELRMKQRRRKCC